jgi:hypothetical protein
MVYARKKMLKYAGQLARVANNEIKVQLVADIGKPSVRVKGQKTQQAPTQAPQVQLTQQAPPQASSEIEFLASLPDGRRVRLMSGSIYEAERVIRNQYPLAGDDVIEIVNPLTGMKITSSLSPTTSFQYNDLNDIDALTV